VNSTAEGQLRCAKCDKRKAESVEKDPQANQIPYFCHAGLIDICVEIRAFVKGTNRLIGFFFAGQVLFEDEERPSAEDVESLQALAKDCRLDFRSLLAHYMRVPRLSRARIEEIRNLMVCFADLVGEMVRKRAAASALLLDIIKNSSERTAVVQAVRRHLDLPAVSIFMEGSSMDLQPPGRVFLAATTYEEFPPDISLLVRENPLDYSYGPAEGFTGWVYDTGQMLYVPDCWNPECYPDKPYKPTWLHKVREVPTLQAARAFLGVPIRGNNGRTVGVIRAIRLKGDRPEDKEPFAEDERELLKGVALLVSAAFQRAQVAEKQVVARATDLEIINSMMMGVALAKSYSRAAQSILDAARRMVPCAIGHLVLTGGVGGGSGLRVEASGPDDLKTERDLLNQAYADRRGVVFYVVRTGKSFCGNVPEDAEKLGINYVKCRGGIRSELTVPIFPANRTRPEGAINLESDRPDAFSEEDLKRLELFANYAGVTLHNVRHMQLSRNIIANGASWFDKAAQALEVLLPRSEQT
jgi:GAF domain-containing protein